MSQLHEILRLLKNGHSLTQYQAAQLLGCYRLAARIHELREMGHDIVSIRQRNNNKTWAEYRLLKSAK